MEALANAALHLQEFLDRNRWKYCFIGGIAVQKWGQVRVTDDIDLTLLTGFGAEEKYIDKLLSYFDARLPNARTFAKQNRVLLLVDKNQIEIDISCGGFPFEQSAVARARKVQLKPGIRLKLCTAEDLIVFKAFAARPIDWMDIEGIIAKQTKKKLDWAYVFTQLTPLVEFKEEPEILSKLKALIDVCE
jgi:predicted nucleotidyltransferase